MRRLLLGYRNCLDCRPVITKSITCGIIFAIGDYLAQTCNHTNMQLLIKIKMDGIKIEHKILLLLAHSTMDPVYIFGTAKYYQK